MQQTKEIHDLERQKKFLLLPEVREPDTTDARGMIKKGRIIERCCTYIADFCYYDKNENYIVEDVKGCKKGAAYEVFKLKRKMMLHFYGIRILET